MNLKSRKGFTLVELIIVIAILGIIALIAVPSLTGVQKRSQVNADIRTAEQIGKSVRVWLTDSTINQARQREAYLKNTNYVELPNMSTAVVTTADSNKFAAAEHGMDDYISLTYAPNVTNESGEELAFYIGLIENKVVVTVAKAEDDELALNGVKAVYGLDADSEVVEGIAYVEGLSNLNADTIKDAINIELDAE